jgi:DNA-binding MarR family transcriptional regulator
VAALDQVAAAPGLRALAEARRFVGVAEDPAGSNRTLFGRWFGADGEPWCAIFLSYCFKVGGGVVLCGGVDGAGVTPKGCAYVPTLEQWLRSSGQWLAAAASPRPGDIVVFNWDGGDPDHAGIVERTLGNGSFESIEGNSEGCVARREHDRTYVVGFGRIRPYGVALAGGYDGSMSSVETKSKLESWVSFLRAHAAITRELNADLQNAHGLTLSDYEVLVHLSRAEDGMMRRVDLAQSVVLTASGITRLLEGLERAGFVEKASCAKDARVSYAKVTTAGRRKLAEATQTHHSGVDELFTGRFSEHELQRLAELLSRLPHTGLDCTAGRD